MEGSLKSSGSASNPLAVDAARDVERAASPGVESPRRDVERNATLDVESPRAASLDVESPRRKSRLLASASHLLHRGESFGALDKQGRDETPWTYAAIATTAAIYVACWGPCSLAAVALATAYGDDAQRLTTIRCCLCELAHGLNACVVKETRHWIFSELDSDARRRGSLERMDEALAKPPSLLGKMFRLSAGYAVWYVLSMAILLREHVGDVAFLLTLVWAFPMTLMVASHYLFTKELWSFLLAHMANLVTANPALIGVALGLDSGPNLVWR
ncbi:hypothetical protein JL721_4217 [Aureococcus anophagefferens]|nr:hypothetical protein JL721_4217 [Aureococcus anophagefferens]